MTKDEYMKRCETIWNTGNARPELFRLLRDWLDAVMRYEHSLFSMDGQTQGRYWLAFLNSEFVRTNDGARTLANDADGYALQEFAAVLCHPCQQCAESKDAWHTRAGFCDHKQPNAALSGSPPKGKE